MATLNPAVCAAKSAHPHAQLKQFLSERRDQLEREYQKHPFPSQLLDSHRKLIDEVLQSLCGDSQLPKSMALLAVGGYGRGELFPYSDVDLLVLLRDSADLVLQVQLERFIGLLWDIGLEVGHSVRTLEQCQEEAHKDVTVQTTLLEARLLYGSNALFRKFTIAIRNTLDSAAFTQAKQLEQQQRHTRFHDTASNLEPNLKESPGGLRDLQNILWIAQACGYGTTWPGLAKRGFITAHEARQIKQHEAFLRDLRIRLHYLAKRREDRLLFDYQGALARQYGFIDSENHRASEAFMQRYYRTAKSISQLNIILLLNLRPKITPAPFAEALPINERFQSRNELLEARHENLFEREPAAILESFLLLQQHPELKGMSAATLRALWRAKKRMNPAFRRSAKNRALFMQILRQPSGITRELRRMNQYGLLGQYLPAFGRIAGQMQHDLFHAYTVDEHILKVVRNLRRFTLMEFAHEYPLCSRLMSEFPRQEVLILAGLFHDIAKGRGGDHSELGSADARRFCKQHGMSAEDTTLVAWLVENHLMMSTTAQKQDLSDPEVIDAFARRMGNERRLIALYLLTVADIRGTSPKVWNAWKGKLLEDLFWLARKRLSGEAVSRDSFLQARQTEALDIIRLYALREDAHQPLWSQLDTVYFLRHDAQEIAWHTRQLWSRVNAQAPFVKARLSPIGEGLQVLIYTPDQKDLFARICGFFDRISYNIVEAKIHTTRHDYALDSFLVLDPSNKTAHYRDLISFVEHELAQRIATQAPLEPPAKGRQSRHVKHFPIAPEVVIHPDERGAHHILSVTAADRPGLLYSIARVLVNYHINMHTAKINTLGERAEDVFLIDGEALNNSRKVVRLEADLLRTLAA
ncbi:MAG TPA: [protein-PII] uridylyltransferase [Burkholderiales bacterium]|nr:[protein-PII] uridylyltransferase [Burkholderiales bacterium]